MTQRVSRPPTEEELLAAARWLGQLALRHDRRVREELGTQMPSPGAVYALLGPALSGLAQEQFHVLVLDSKLRLVRDVLLYQGTLLSCPVRVAEVFREAIVLGGSHIILVHNHPSGDPMPSAEDIVLSRTIAQAGALLDIPLTDHIVIGAATWCSLRERGLL